jgi:hypothetical protein
MSRLQLQNVDEWVPIKDASCIGVLDCTTARAMEEPVPLDGDGLYPENGIAIDVSASEESASARRDLLDELGLTPEALLAVSERGVRFARWDPPQTRETGPLPRPGASSALEWLPPSSERERWKARLTLPTAC